MSQEQSQSSQEGHQTTCDSTLSPKKTGIARETQGQQREILKEDLDRWQAFFLLLHELYNKVFESLPPGKKRQYSNSKFFDASTSVRNVIIDKGSNDDKDIQVEIDQFIDHVEFAFEVTAKAASEDHIEVTPPMTDWLEVLSGYRSRGSGSAFQIDKTKLPELTEKIRRDFGNGREPSDECKRILEFLMKGYKRTPAVKHEEIEPEEICVLYDALDYESKKDGVLKEFLDTFQVEYIGNHLKNSTEEKEFYARCVIIIQSSGTGKTRLARQVGRFVPSFAITLGAIDGKSGSIPGPDMQCVRFFWNESKKKPGHMIFACFLAALHKHLLIDVAREHSEANLEEGQIRDEEIGFLIPAMPGSEKEWEEWLDKRDEEYWEGYDQKLDAAFKKCTKYLREVHIKKNFDYQKDVLEVQYELRAKKENEKRSAFLQSVITTAKMLCRKCTFDEEESKDDTEGGSQNSPKPASKGAPSAPKEAPKVDRYKYLEESTLKSTVEAYFNYVIDGRYYVKKKKQLSKINKYIMDTSSLDDDDDSVSVSPSLPVSPGDDEDTDMRDAISSTQDSPEQDRFNEGEGHQQAEKRGIEHYRQAILVVDECRHAKSLFCNVEELPKKHPYPQGIGSLLRPYADLEDIALGVHMTAGQSKKKDGTIASPERRMWIFLLDTTDQFPTLRPSSDNQLMKVSSRLLGSTKQLGSYWSSLGMDHMSRELKRKFPGMFSKLPLEVTQSFQFIKICGRGMWSAYKNIGILLRSAVEKLCGGPIDGVNTIFREDYDPRNDDRYISDITYQLASFRFNLDTGFVSPADSICFDIQSRSVGSHMRFLDKLGDAHSILTSTPPEAMLGAISLLLMNYGDYMADNWKSPNLRWGTKLSDVVWKNMLDELKISCLENSRIVDAGNAGELVARILLTRARDECLQKEWRVRNESVPFFLLSEWLKKLNGENVQKEVFELAAEKLDNVDLEYAIMNFNQFVQICSPLFDKKQEMSNVDSFYHPQLLDAFRKMVALITIPGQKGLDALIPVLLPTKDGLKALRVRRHKVGTSKLDMDDLAKLTEDEYEIHFIGIDVKWRDGGVSAADKLFSPSSVGIDKEVVRQSAFLIIRMDLGCNAPFQVYKEGGDLNEDNLEEKSKKKKERKTVDKYHYCSVEERIETKEEYLERLGELTSQGVEAKQSDREHKMTKFIGLKIRGIKDASYPCMKRVDPAYEFRDAALKTKAGRGERYPDRKCDALVAYKKMPRVKGLEKGVEIGMSTIDTREAKARVEDKNVDTELKKLLDEIQYETLDWHLEEVFNDEEGDRVDDINPSSARNIKKRPVSMMIGGDERSNTANSSTSKANKRKSWNGSENPSSSTILASDNDTIAEYSTPTKSKRRKLESTTPSEDEQTNED